MNNLKKLRQEKNKLQKDIAEVLGIRQTAYSRYEQNSAEPSIENLIKLADYYQVSVDYLVGREWNDEIGFLSEDVREVIEILKNLNAKNIGLVKIYAMALNDSQEDKNNVIKEYNKKNKEN